MVILSGSVGGCAQVEPETHSASSTMKRQEVDVFDVIRAHSIDVIARCFPVDAESVGTYIESAELYTKHTSYCSPRPL